MPLPLTNFLPPFYAVPSSLCSDGAAARISRIAIYRLASRLSASRWPLDPRLSRSKFREAGFNAGALAISQFGGAQIRYSDTHASGIYRIQPHADKKGRFCHCAKTRARNRILRHYRPINALLQREMG